MSENRITHPDGSSQAGGCCDYCFTGIAFEFHIRSADGKESKVGCNCIAKVGDKGLMQAYKSSPEYRKHQRELKNAKAMRDHQAFLALIADYRNILAAYPHPYGFTNRETGKPMTALDYAEYQLSRGKSELRWLKLVLDRHLSAAMAA